MFFVDIKLILMIQSQLFLSHGMSGFTLIENGVALRSSLVIFYCLFLCCFGANIE